MQLLPGRPLEAALPGLAARLLDQLLTQPPYELGWLGLLSNADKVGQAVGAHVLWVLRLALQQSTMLSQWWTSVTPWIQKQQLEEAVTASASYAMRHTY